MITTPTPDPAPGTHKPVSCITDTVVVPANVRINGILQPNDWKLRITMYCNGKRTAILIHK